MIITVRGMQNGTKAAACATGLLSAMTAIVRSKKTFVFQLTDFGAPSILEILEGKALKAQELQMAFKLYRDEGVDAIFLRAETADLTKEHFDQTVTGVLDKQNLFDVLKETNKKEFFEFLNKDNIKNVLTGAKQIYDYIYILLPEDKDMIEAVQEYSDEDIIVVPQGPAIDVGELTPKTKIIVNDFEVRSIYGAREMAKDYGIKKVYTIPHNYQFRDAVISETLLDFVLNNRRDMREDLNYEFTQSIIKLLDKYVKGDNDDDEEIEVEKVPKKEKIETTKFPDLLETPDEAVQEVTVKKGLFGKKKRLTADI